MFEAIKDLDYIRAFWMLSPNFGDALTPWLIQKITGQKVVWVNPDCDDIFFMVTGSILNHRAPKAVVWGCGLAWFKDEIKDLYHVRAVRGPMSLAKAISYGYPIRGVFGDPALLLPDLITDTIPMTSHRLGITPHFVDYDFVYNKFKDIPEVSVINMMDSIEEVVKQICFCDHILSSSLHGLIVAHAYLKPALWVQFSDKVLGDGFKFFDYLMSVQLPLYLPQNLRGISPADIIELDIVRKLGEASHRPSQDTLSKLRKGLWDSCPFLTSELTI